MKKLIVPLILLFGLLAACGGQEAQEQARIQAAVAATLSHIPTQTPYPQPTAFFPPTPIALDGTFCEYGFCIGHPADLYLVDATILNNPASPSNFAYGILFAFNPGLFIQVTWTTSGPSFDHSLVQGFILEEKDALTGALDVMLYKNLNIYYQPIGPTASDLLPYGAIAAWQCGGRDFAWKVYTPQDGMAQNLLQQALERFRCE
jgi:hypothetical protein